jgi:hypothetical protein
MKKYCLMAVLLLCSSSAWALTVGQVLAPIQQNTAPQRDIAIQYWTGLLEMALLMNAQMAQSGKPLFCLPTPAPNIQQIFNTFTQDTAALVKTQGMEKASSMQVPDVLLRTLTSHYGACK